MKILNQILKLLGMKKYLADERGMSFTETAILFPVLLSMMMAVYDLGQGVIINQKTVAASQIIGDLITRREVVDMQYVTDVVNAGELAFAPYAFTSFGYDITSVEFDENEDPVILWRVTENMDQGEAAINGAAGLGGEGEGVVVVSVVFEYVPYFSNFVVDIFNMNEIAYLRGRKSATVLCTDCPG